MLYRLLAFISLLLLSINLFSQSNPSIIDTTFTFSYSIEGDTLPQSRRLAGYNLSMKIVYQENALWDLEKNAWHFVSKNLYDYTEAGLYSLVEKYQWSDEQDMWTGTQKRTTTYDDNNHQDSSVSFSWYEGAWVNKNKSIYKLDSIGRFLYQAYYLWDTIQNTWDIQNLTNQEYDSSGNILLQETYQIDNAGDQIGQKFEYIYNDFGKRTMEIVYSWNSEQGDWVYNRKSEYEYNTEIDYSQLLMSNWNPLTESWIPYSRTLQDWDDDGYYILYENYLWNGSLWIGQNKRKISYDAAGNIAVEEQYNWDQWDNDWVGYLKNINSYNDSGKVVLVIQQAWYLSDWINIYKSVYEYEIDDLKTLEEYWEWNYAAGIWVGRFRNLNTYDDSALKTDAITQLWSSQDADWVNSTWYESRYNDAGLEVFTQTYVWLESSWQNKYRTESEYDEDGERVVNAKYTYDSDLEAWIGNYKYALSYNIDEKDIIMVSYAWSMEIMDWVFSTKIEHEVNEDGIYTMTTNYSWNPETESWTGTSKTTKEINTNGLVSGQSTYLWDDVNEAFYLSSRSMTFFGGYYIEEFGSICDGESYTWKDTTIADAGIYMDKYVSLNMRDSVQVIILEEGISQFISIEQSLCKGENISWAGQELFETGVYFDTLVAVNGCDSIIELELTVLDLPSTGKITGADGVTLQEIQIYSVSNDLELTYTWEVQGGIILGNPEANSVEVRWDTLGLGNVAVKAENETGCLSEPEGLAVAVGMTDVARNSFSGNMIYPNPVRDVLYIQSIQKQTMKEIFDLTGKKLSQSTESTINISFLSPGSYYIVLKNKEGSILHKELFVKH